MPKYSIKLVADGHELDERIIVANDINHAVIVYEKETGNKLDNQQYTIKRISNEPHN